MPIEKTKALDMYRTMVRIRIFEDRVSKEFAAGNIQGIVHLYLGEEAIAVGACAHLRPDDYIVSTHRGHGHLIAKGGHTDRMMAEIFGKRTGYCKGKGGSMHIADPEIGMLGANGVVGAGIPVATGAALAAQIRGTDQVALSFFGDGACNTSRFHEAINMGAAWKLPVVYIIENNLWMVSTRTTDVMGITELSSRAAGYGIPGLAVDGNDVVAVYEVVGEAVARARAGGGPTLIDCKTYRWHGHMEGDSQAYKPKEEVAAWMKKDPLPRFEKYLFDNGVLSRDGTDSIKQEILKEIDNAVKFAQDSPYPSSDEVKENVFA
jgi:TPP-dependent pyruvate/acetoin dehydrogenase alpha subunit